MNELGELDGLLILAVALLATTVASVVRNILAKGRREAAALKVAQQMPRRRLVTKSAEMHRRAA